MKKNRFLALLWLVVIAWTLAGCWNKNWELIIEDVSSKTDASINYNDNLVNLATNCIMSEDTIRNTYDDENSSIEDIRNAINSTVKECTTAQKNIKSLWDWEWDSSLKDWALDVIDKYITYYSKFGELLPYIEQEEITEEENQSYESLLAEIEFLDNELNEANKNLIAIQEQFAKNHWFELETNEEEASEEIETYNEETETYNEEETNDETETYNEEETNEETPENEIEE